MNRTFRIVLACVLIAVVLGGVSTVTIVRWTYIRTWFDHMNLQPVDVTVFPSNPDEFHWWPIDASYLKNDGYSVTRDNGTMYLTSRLHERIALTDTGEIYDTKSHTCTLYIDYEDDPENPDLNIQDSCQMNGHNWAFAFTKGEPALLFYYDGKSWEYVLIDDSGFHH
jgi:hypothetical protein